MIGWQCPGCGRCYSPGWMTCSYCGQPKEEGATHTIPKTTDGKV